MLLYLREADPLSWSPPHYTAKFLQKPRMDKLTTGFRDSV